MTCAPVMWHADDFCGVGDKSLAVVACTGSQPAQEGSLTGECSRGLLALVELLRQVQLVTYFRDLVLLCFEPVDVMFFVFQNMLK